MLHKLKPLDGGRLLLVGMLVDYVVCGCLVFSCSISLLLRIALLVRVPLLSTYDKFHCCLFKDGIAQN